MFVSGGNSGFISEVEKKNKMGRDSWTELSANVDWLFNTLIQQSLKCATGTSSLQAD